MDSTTPAERYAQASHAHADNDQGRLAVLAMCASDLETLRKLLWENGLDRAPDPDGQLGAVAQAVLDSLTGVTATSDSPSTAREAAELFRQALVTTFDPSVHALLTQRLLPLDHLDDVASLDEQASGSAEERASGSTDKHTPDRPADALVADLRRTAADCAVVSELMADEGDLPGALAQVWQADLATFEACLVRTAVAAGDTDLATVDLRWDLARGLVTPPDGSEAFADLVATWRDAFTEAVTSREAAALRAAFPPAPFR